MDWHSLPLELSEYHIIRDKLDPASRQAFSWTCKEYHARLYDSRLVWIKNKNVMLNEYQKQFIREAGRDHLLEFCSHVDSELSFYKILQWLVFGRSVTEINEFVSKTRVDDLFIYESVVAFYFLLDHRCSDYILWVTLKNNPPGPSHFLEMAHHGLVELLIKYLEHASVRDISNIIMRMIMTDASVDWKLLFSDPAWHFHWISIQIHTSPLIFEDGIFYERPPGWKWIQLPHLWPYFTTGFKRGLAHLIEEHNGEIVLK